MKKRNRILAAFLLLTMTFGLFTGIFPAASAADSGSAYRQKIVSVLYDNSGSMSNPDNRDSYASYALQTLMAMFSENDKMYITPMNIAIQQACTDFHDGFEVNLAARNRNDEVQRIISNKVLRPLGNSGTPSVSIKTAVNRLVDCGMKKSSQSTLADEDREYWLVILTDGAFENETNRNTISGYIEQYASGYASLQTIYFGMSPEAVDLTGTSAVNSCNMTPKKVDNPQKIISTLQDISCQMLGRYELDQAIYSVSGKTVSVDLSKMEYPLKSITVLTQDSGATLKSVRYNDKKMTVSQSSTIVADQTLNIRNGSVDVINGEFSSGTLVLEFDAEPNQLTILVEPDLALRVTLEYFDGSQWIPTDENYVTMNLHPGDKVRTAYEVYERANGSAISFETIFNDVQSKVLYQNKQYQVGDAIPLVENYSELLTTVTAMNGSFFLRDTKKFNIEANPNLFRIESAVHEGYQGKPDQYEFEYTVFFDDRAVTFDQLAQSFSWEAELTNADGSKTKPKAEAGKDGKIRVVADVKGTLLGQYAMKLTVTHNGNGRVREKTDTIDLYPKTISLQLEGNARIEETTYSVKNNTDAISYVLTADGAPIAFDNGLITYQLKVNGQNVTKGITVSGNTLSYVPNAGSLPAGCTLEGTYPVVMEVSCRSKDSPLNVKNDEAVLTVKESKYQLITLASDQKSIDKFRDNPDAALYFTVLCDGVAVPKSQIEEMLQTGDLSIHAEKANPVLFQPLGITQEAVEYQGQGAVKVSSRRQLWKIFDDYHADMVSTFLFVKDDTQDVTVSFEDQQVTDGFEILENTFWEYFYRHGMLVLIMAIEVWIINIIWKVVKQMWVPGGYLITVDGYGAHVQASAAPVNRGLFAKILWVMFGPWFTGQKIETGFPVDFKQKSGGFPVLLVKESLIKTEISPGRYGDLFNEYLSSLRSGNTPEAAEEILAQIRVARALNRMFTIRQRVDETDIVNAPNEALAGAPYQVSGADEIIFFLFA